MPPSPSTAPQRPSAVCANSTGPAPSGPGLVARRIDTQEAATHLQAQPDPQHPGDGEREIDGGAAWEIRVERFRQDVAVHRKLLHADGTPRPRPGGGRRGAIQSFSPAAARRLRFLLRNAGRLPYLLHLTYPAAFPTDGARVKRDWRLLREWLGRQGRGGVWVLEFQARRGPHFMVLLDGPVAKDAVSARWAAVVGSGDPAHLRSGTRVERVRNPAATIEYMLKKPGDTQKQIPPGYGSVGKLWGRFGGVHAEPVEVLEGSREELAPVVRSLRKLETSERRKRARGKTGNGPGKARPLRDNGVSGWTALGLGPAAGRCLERLAPWLLNVRLTSPGRLTLRGRHASARRHRPAAEPVLYEGRLRRPMRADWELLEEWMQVQARRWAVRPSRWRGRRSLPDQAVEAGRLPGLEVRCRVLPVKQLTTGKQRIAASANATARPPPQRPLSWPSTRSVGDPSRSQPSARGTPRRSLSAAHLASEVALPTGNGGQ